MHKYGDVRYCEEPRQLVFELVASPLRGSEFALADSMDDRGGQLQHSRLRGSLGAHLNGNSAVAGERVGQHVEFLAVNPDPLRRGVPELPDACTNLGGCEIAMAGSHLILVSGRKKTPLPNLLFHAFCGSSAVIPVTD